MQRDYYQCVIITLLTPILDLKDIQHKGHILNHNKTFRETYQFVKQVINFHKQQRMTWKSVYSITICIIFTSTLM